MRRFRCPICKTEFQGTLEHCPKCGTRLHYQNEEKKREEVKPAPKQTFFYDDDRVNKRGIVDDEELMHQNADVTIRHVEGGAGSVNAPRGVTTTYYENFNNGESKFDGVYAQKMSIFLTGAFMCIVTLFLALPAAVVMMYKWEAQHTVICGHRLDFDGKASQLFGRYVLWLFLTIITFGIFSYWLMSYLKKWKMKHTIFMVEDKTKKNKKEILIF